MLIYISLQYQTNKNLKQTNKMKTTNFKSNLSQLQEKALRILFSFQLLAIGFLLPALFAIGIHTMSPKQQDEVRKTEGVTNVAEAHTFTLTNQNG